MKNKKELGIWMDHSSADLLELNSKNKKRSVISEFTFETKEEALRKNENLMHNKRQQMQEAYYKEIAKEILPYDHVLLFGPTNAKVELYNYICKDLKYKNIQIDVEPADKMTDNEKIALLKSHFNSSI